MRRRSHFFSNLVYYTTTVKINPQKFIKYLEKKGKLNRVIIDLSGQITYNKNYILGEFRESYTEDTMDTCLIMEIIIRMVEIITRIMGIIIRTAIKRAVMAR